MSARTAAAIPLMVVTGADDQVLPGIIQAVPLSGIKDGIGGGAILAVYLMANGGNSGVLPLHFTLDSALPPLTIDGNPMLDTFARDLLLSFTGDGYYPARELDPTTDGQGEGAINHGLAGAMARLQGYDETDGAYNRVRVQRVDDDENITTPAVAGSLDTFARLGLDQAGAYVRARGITASSADPDFPIGTLKVAQQTEWTETDGPAAATQATCTRVNPGGGARLVCRSITARVATAGTAQTPLRAVLRDGATGVGAILWEAIMACPVNSADGVELTPNIVGSADADMTLEFTAGGVAASVQTVSLSGYTAL